MLRLYYQYSPDRLSACPITIHALLHIADGIEDAGSVWAYWAFPTERYCGRLQPAIRSRRYPFANIDNYVVANAQLSQIKIRYGLEEKLALKPTRTDQMRGSFSHPACKHPFSPNLLRLTGCGYWTDPTCILLPPRRPSSTISVSLAAKIVISLSMRFNKPQSIIRQYFSIENAEQWARVRRLEGGDDINASSLVIHSEDRRDATFVRVRSVIHCWRLCF
jgi:hypothetical protein